jgi:serine/threonine protein kinase
MGNMPLGFIYIDMELCDYTLAEFLSKQQRFLQLPAISSIMGDISAAVAYIHERDLAHRDLKPQNSTILSIKTELNLVLYSEPSKAWKIGDFGLATSATLHATGTPQGRGSEGYRAPEVLIKSTFSTAVDIWAMGCILYELVIGSPPFRNVFEMYRYGLSGGGLGALDSITDSRRSLVRWIRLMLSADPLLRPNASQLVRTFRDPGPEAALPGFAGLTIST